MSRRNGIWFRTFLSPFFSNTLFYFQDPGASTLKLQASTPRCWGLPCGETEVAERRAAPDPNNSQGRAQINTINYFPETLCDFMEVKRAAGKTLLCTTDMQLDIKPMHLDLYARLTQMNNFYLPDTQILENKPKKKSKSEKKRSSFCKWNYSMQKNEGNPGPRACLFIQEDARTTRTCWYIISGNLFMADLFHLGLSWNRLSSEQHDG